MSKLKMPAKGQSAAMLAELQAEEVAEPLATPQQETKQRRKQRTNVTRLHDKEAAVAPEPTDADTAQGTSAPADTAAVTEATTLTQETATSSLPEDRAERLALALQHAAEDAISVVTVRVPGSLNRYMDDYVARVNRAEPGRKYRKQDAVAEAFAAFYADHPLPPLPADDELK